MRSMVSTKAPRSIIGSQALSVLLKKSARGYTVSSIRSTKFPTSSTLDAELRCEVSNSSLMEVRSRGTIAPRPSSMSVKKNRICSKLVLRVEAVYPAPSVTSWSGGTTSPYLRMTYDWDGDGTPTISYSRQASSYAFDSTRRSRKLAKRFSSCIPLTSSCWSPPVERFVQHTRSDIASRRATLGTIKFMLLRNSSSFVASTCHSCRPSLARTKRTSRRCERTDNESNFLDTPRSGKFTSQPFRRICHMLGRSGSGSRGASASRKYIV
mmetsp:Transcript_1787/g.4922  ORF Transcript_1787/g.4922 Transcript_1787/m.4922 type:complete len:267 (+) Transcript_1787:135-935(+)